MAPAPVTLQEFRDFLNVDASDTSADEERWAKVLTAVSQVEAKVGALEPRSVSSRVIPHGMSEVLLPVTPVISVESVTDNATAATLTLAADSLDTVGGVLMLPYVPLRYGSYGSLTVVYTAGRIPVPPDLREAVLIVAEQLWQSQRGPSANTRYSPTGSEQARPSGFAWPNKAVEITDFYERVGVA